MLTYLIVFLGVQLLQGLFLWKGYQKAGYKGVASLCPYMEYADSAEDY